MTLFLCATILDDIALVKVVVENKGGLWGERQSDIGDAEDLPARPRKRIKTLESGVTGYHVLILTSARADFFDAIPPHYSLALLRASRTHGKHGVFHRDYSGAIAEEMARILEGQVDSSSVSCES